MPRDIRRATRNVPTQNYSGLACIVLTAALCACQQQPPATPLSTGRVIDPSIPALSRDVGSMPLTLLISPDAKYALTTSAGYRDKLCCIRIADGQLVSHLDFQPARTDKTNGLYYGLAFGPDGKIYATMGAAAKVAVILLAADGTLTLEKQIPLAAGDFAAGIALDNQGRLYITQNDPSDAKSPLGAAPGAVSIYDSTTSQELGRYTFSDPLGLTNFPLGALAMPDGQTLFVASERDDAVYVLSTADPAHIQLRAKLSTGSHPTALLMNRDHSKLFVANSQSDTVSVVDTSSLAILQTIRVRPGIARDLAGATPTGLALSANEKMLYVTLGDMNAVAAIDLAEAGGPKVEGYIPTGWYPTSVAVVGRDLLFTNAKGDKTHIPHDFSEGTTVTSPLNLFEGTLWRMPVPRGPALATLTEKSLAQARLTPTYWTNDNPLEGLSLKSGRIQHVIYVIKENRTYDQLLGDLPQGNGDPSRCLFGQAVTPNTHALAQRFILMDNFYDSGDVSGDGWVWSTQAQANEYTVRNIPYHYSQRGRNYDFEGSNNKYPSGGLPSAGPDGKPLSDDPRFKNGAPPVTDVAEAAGGHLWDNARKHNVTYRNYGFYLTDGVEKNGQTIMPDNYPASTGLQPGGRDLAGLSNIDFRKFDLDYPDSDGPRTWAARTGAPADFLWPKTAYGAANSPSRFAEWKREFDLMLSKDPTGKSIPNLMMIRFPTDHTRGATAEKASPRCMVADNDYAVGQLVDAVSHSPIWQSTVLIILEDDAQNGPDHVDAHRSICLVVSPWIKKATIDHSFQNTVSTIHTIESLLDLPPMCQYDAAAGVIGGWDSAPRNAESYAAILPDQSIFKERNPKRSTRENSTTAPATGPQPGLHDTQSAAPAAPALRTPDDLAAVSASMDFDHADRAPADLLNEVIWKSIRGVDSKLPPTPHAIGAQPLKDDDD